jgi:threonine/homoserine/homoserine lactone efflux protein
MVGSAALAGMAAVALGMALTPGPNMMYLVSRSISQGRRAGMVSLAGTFVGFLVYMTMANLGLASAFVLVPALYIAVKGAGAAYLLWLAWNALRPGGLVVFETTRLSPDSEWKLFRSGLLTNLLNPKAAIMYLALIPQFIRPGAGSVVLQGFELGGVQIALSMAVNGTLIVVAGGVARFLASRPAWTRWQRRITGTMLGAIGLRLALEAPARARV